MWQARLSELLSASGAGRDEEILAAARLLLRELDAAGRQGGVNVIDIRGAKGVQVGDHNTRTNTFN
ncbi:hypothetical protein HRW14_12050 [Streptomyces lunaelactis]|uniref:RIP homotypic interaction motif-containing protein n=1 Tax=Streptomyces lunaelactis TaxID=1535768 RepID=UPI0015855715|nr:RIP homotypic interaction motif-containing protein [Streptomyces lunaelactis]NUK25744.1 hypothetical protein [Streptomyces lunaelactis]NUK32432.1 hypothetical protein [Streptomyces lunaelactis]NUK39449.1 hypothetical protein [Streptomyces lunaelactis]NUK50992.1 hypothetical protein [Streptomyces lunaelactis]NUK59831.1 hypothetical protein [Streptomyces lunaelactis]